MTLAIGTTVWVSELRERRELNGDKGEITSFDARSSRYAVHLETGESVALLRENLSELDPSDAYGSIWQRRQVETSLHK
tara:strand:- start:1454 stop:1690 length:237 start_codon:yes stop_codon:yes gene_type:complete